MIAMPEDSVEVEHWPKVVLVTGTILCIWQQRHVSRYTLGWFSTTAEECHYLDDPWYLEIRSSTKQNRFTRIESFIPL